MKEFSQQKVRDASVVVVGCGALGNEVLKNLALAGVGRMTLIDFDEVEDSNLNRSVLFRKEDAFTGRRKVDAAAERLKELNAGIDISTIFGDVAYDVGLDVFRDADVVIGCVDSRWARYCINRLCMRAGVPWVDGGINGLEGTARVFAPGRNCYACNLGAEGLEELRRRASCAGTIRRAEKAGHVPTTGVAASVIGAVQAQEALKIINAGAEDDGSFTFLLGRIFYYDGAHMTTRIADFNAFDDDCPVHECWGPVKSSGLGVESTVGDALEIFHSFFLHDDCFVDKIECNENGKVFDAMLPGRKVAGFVENHEYLRGFPFSQLSQNEYRCIDETFPYPFLTLGELGIPPKDVLKTRKGTDTNYYSIN